MYLSHYIFNVYFSLLNQIFILNKQLLLYFAIRECQIVGLFSNEFQFSCSDRTSVTRNLYWFCNKSPRKMSRFISSYLNKLRHKYFEMFRNMMQNDIGHQWNDNTTIHSICIRTVSLAPIVFFAEPV